MRLTISRKITFVLIVTLTLVVGGLGLSTYLGERRMLYRDLAVEEARLVERLSFVVRDPLWFLDTPTLEQLIEFEMSDPGILAIRIMGEDGVNLITGLVRSGESVVAAGIEGTGVGDTEIVDGMISETPPPGVFSRYVSPIQKDDTLIGYLVVDTTDGLAKDELRGSLGGIIFQLAALALVLGGVIYMSLRRIVIVRVQHLHAQVDRLATGDLRDIAVPKGSDEISELGIGLVQLVTRLQAMLGNLKSVSDTNTVQGERIAARLEEVATATSQIDTSMGQAVDGTRELTEEVDHAHTTAEHIRARIRELTQAAETQHTAVLNAVADVRGMLHELTQVAERARSRLAGLGEIDRNAALGAREMSATRQAIKEITGSVGSILEVIGVIDDVAARSNLLAMNAAIEAAHAGASGRGFAVVAGEVRSLSQVTAQHAREVAGRVQAVAAEMAQSDERAGRTEEVIADVLGVISATSEDIQSVLRSVESLSDRSANIDALLGSVSTLSAGVSDTTGIIDEESGGITRAMEHVRELAAQTLRNMADMTTGIGSVSENMGALADAGAQNSTITRTINDELKTFTVDGRE